MKHDVLIADDDDQLRELLGMMFEEEFNLHFAENFATTIEKIKESNFQFIILDIHMPDGSGLDVCRAINEMKADLQPQIVILSGDNDDVTVKKAYELGVADYITKPFNVTAFHERMLRISRDLDTIAKLEEKDSANQSVTQTVMKQSAAYGSALELISRLNTCHNNEELAGAILKNFLQQGFHAAIQFRGGDDVYSEDVDEKHCSTIELQVFDVLKDKGRIYSFGKRCIFNDHHVSILVKNMPKENTPTYDSLIDVAAKVVPAINARYMAICEHQSLLMAQEKLNSALAMLSEGVSELESEKKQMMESIEMQIGLSFHKLDLDETQEKFFMDMIEHEIRSKEESNKLDMVQTIISDCVDSLNIMEDEDEPEPEAEGSNDDDIELF